MTTKANLVTIAALFLLLILASAACEPSPSGGSPTAEPGATSPEPNVPSPSLPVATDTPTPSVTPRRTWTPYATPTLEFCEAVTIEYRVLVPTLYVRDGRGATFARVGELSAGDTFIGSLCVDPDASNTYYWTQILQDGHPYQGKWVAYLSVDYSARFLE